MKPKLYTIHNTHQQTVALYKMDWLESGDSYFLVAVVRVAKDLRQIPLEHLDP